MFEPSAYLHRHLMAPAVWDFMQISPDNILSFTDGACTKDRLHVIFNLTIDDLELLGYPDSSPGPYSACSAHLRIRCMRQWNSQNPVVLNKLNALGTRVYTILELSLASAHTDLNQFVRVTATALRTPKRTL